MHLILDQFDDIVVHAADSYRLQEDDHLLKNPPTKNRNNNPYIALIRKSSSISWGFLSNSEECDILSLVLAQHEQPMNLMEFKAVEKVFFLTWGTYLLAVMKGLGFRV